MSGGFGRRDEPSDQATQTDLCTEKHGRWVLERFYNSQPKREIEQKKYVSKKKSKLLYEGEKERKKESDRQLLLSLCSPAVCTVGCVRDS